MVIDIYTLYIYLSNGKITSNDIQYKLEEINSILGKKYALVVIRLTFSCNMRSSSILD
ncbi:hypothetical protein [Ferroplasma sp.]|uniref:hypothetical protein n=1 Tax=Ferroplasma sp. TaxID=2591003 RepID=UPI00261D7C59|nr:hypothetical protein [Ferroplasma sp.]